MTHGNLHQTTHGNFPFIPLPFPLVYTPFQVSAWVNLCAFSQDSWTIYVHICIHVYIYMYVYKYTYIHMGKCVTIVSFCYISIVIIPAQTYNLCGDWSLERLSVCSRHSVRTHVCGWLTGCVHVTTLCPPVCSRIDCDLYSVNTQSTGVRFHLFGHRLKEYTNWCMVTGMCKYVSTLWQWLHTTVLVTRGNHAPLRVHLYVHASIVICPVLVGNLRGLDSIWLFIDCRNTQMGVWFQ